MTYPVARETLVFMTVSARTTAISRPVQGRWPVFLRGWIIAAAGGAGLAASLPGEEVSLDSVWRWTEEHRPGYEIARFEASATEAEMQALRREGWPAFSIEAGGDYGQRVRPGEERDQGIAGRGEVLARLDWSLLQSGRNARERALALRRLGVIEAGAAFDHALRAEVARIYVELALELDRQEILREGLEAFSRIAEVVERRNAEGVEPAGAVFRITERRAAFTIDLGEAGDRIDALTTQLAAITGRELRPANVTLDPEAVLTRQSVAPNPRLAELRLQAEERRADAEVLRETDRWRVDLYGAAGPYFSEAFDDRYEQEYFGGLRFIWSPDVAGVRRERSLAQRQRARALESEEADLRARFVERTEFIRRELRDYALRWSGKVEVIEQARNSERAAQLRWREGVGSWRDFADELDEAVEARLDEVAWRKSMADRVIEYAEITAGLDALPGWLGQERSP